MFDWNVTNTVTAYIFEKREWIALPDMKYPRREHSSCFLNKKLFVFGGYHGRELDSIEWLDTFPSVMSQWYVNW